MLLYIYYNEECSHTIIHIIITITITITITIIIKFKICSVHIFNNNRPEVYTETVITFYRNPTSKHG